MSIKCVITICINGENRYKWMTCTDLRDIKAAARILDNLVHCGKCDWYLISFEGEIAS